MKVLFVSSGNSKFGISPIICNQGESLKKEGILLEYFTIQGKGFLGYLKNIKKLKEVLKKNDFDIIHSHYSLSSFVASLAGGKNHVVSLMGSDVNSGFVFRRLIKVFNLFFWKKCFVKSEQMKQKIGLKDVEVVPNGVDIDKFKSLSKSKCQKELGWIENRKHIFFPANPERKGKNFKLAELAVKLLNDDQVELHSISNVPHEKMAVLFNAADSVLFTSISEGSPNVIKEAMACNCPIISTNVGDVGWVIGELTRVLCYHI